MNTNQTNMEKQQNEGQNEMTSQANNNPVQKSRQKENKQKRQAIPPMWRILGKAQKAFNAQLDKDNKMKFRCIDMYLNSEMNDAPRFWGEFMVQVERLLDSRKYVMECKQLVFDATNVAEHIVFLGSAKLNKVLMFGVQSVLKNDLMLYGERLSPEVADVYRKKITTFLESGKSPAPVDEAA